MKPYSRHIEIPMRVLTSRDPHHVDRRTKRRLRKIVFLALGGTTQEECDEGRTLPLAG